MTTSSSNLREGLTPTLTLNPRSMADRVERVADAKADPNPES